MPAVNVNGINLAYEFYGDKKQPVLLLVQGLGMPLTAWPPELVKLFVDSGFRVLLFDNRDIGQSQLMDELGFPSVPRQALRAMLRMKVIAPYQLQDMMLDTLALLDALNIDKAHVVGISMGGMIAQLLAIHAPERTHTLTSIMSTTGNRKLPGPKWEISRHLISRPASNALEDRLAHSTKTWQLIGSPGYPTDAQRLNERLGRIFERGSPPSGIARQMVAIMAAPTRVPQLQKLNVPTLVIHGDADPLVPVEAGIDTARAVSDSQLHIIPGMGHDLPLVLLPTLHQLINQHARDDDRLAGAA